MFLRLWMITELEQLKIFTLVLQAGGAAIIFPKSGQNQKSDTTLSKKTFLLALTSVIEIFLRCTIFEFGFFVSKNIQMYCMKNRKCSNMMFLKKMIKR